MNEFAEPFSDFRGLNETSPLFWFYATTSAVEATARIGVNPLFADTNLIKNSTFVT